MSMKHVIALSAVLFLIGGSEPAFPQGVQTGTIRGQVKDQQNLPIPGVTVTATSPALQGPRSTVTDTLGLFTIAALPAGAYAIKFELNGFTSIERHTVLPLGLTVDENITMRAAGVSETIQVVAETPGPIATAVVGENFKHDEIERLATPRTIQGIAQLAPAVNENSPNAGQIVVNGAFAYDNIFMINGVDINDNLFAQPQNL